MDVFDVIDFDLGELVAGGLQLVLAVVLVGLGLLVMLASLVVDVAFLWGLVLFVAGIVVGLIAVASFLDAFL